MALFVVLFPGKVDPSVEYKPSLAWLRRGGSGSRVSSAASAAKGPPLKRSLLDPNLRDIAIFFSLVMAAVGYLGGVLPDLANNKAAAEGRADAGVYNSLLYALLGNGVTVLLSPVAGVILGKMGNGGFSALFLSSALSLASCIALTYVPSLPVISVVLILFGACKGFLMSSTFSFIASFFPPSHYGSLVAVVTASAAVVGTVNIGVGKTTTSYGTVLAVYLALTLALLWLPYRLFKNPSPTHPSDCDETFLDSEFDPAFQTKNPLLQGHRGGDA